MSQSEKHFVAGESQLCFVKVAMKAFSALALLAIGCGGKFGNAGVTISPRLEKQISGSQETISKSKLRRTQLKNQGNRSVPSPKASHTSGPRSASPLKAFQSESFKSEKSTEKSSERSTEASSSRSSRSSSPKSSSLKSSSSRSSSPKISPAMTDRSRQVSSNRRSPSRSTSTIKSSSSRIGVQPVDSLTAVSETALAAIPKGHTLTVSSFVSDHVATKALLGQLIDVVLKDKTICDFECAEATQGKMVVKELADRTYENLKKISALLDEGVEYVTPLLEKRRRADGFFDNRDAVSFAKQAIDYAYKKADEDLKTEVFGSEEDYMRSKKKAEKFMASQFDVVQELFRRAANASSSISRRGLEPSSSISRRGLEMAPRSLG